MSIDYTKPSAAERLAESVVDPAPAAAMGAAAKTILPVRPGMEARETMLLARLERLLDEQIASQNAGASDDKLAQYQRRIDLTLESLDDVRRPQTGRRSLGDITLIELGVLIVLAIIVFLIGKAVWGHFTSADDSVSNVRVTQSADEAFLSSVRAESSVPDPDDVLLGVGGVICLSINEKGDTATRAELATSSYSSVDQAVIYAAAVAYLC